MTNSSFTVSASWTGILQLDTSLVDEHRGIVIPRRSDFGMRGMRARVHHVRDGISAVLRARHTRCLVISNAMIEVLVATMIRWIVAPRLRIVACDFLIPDLDRWGRVLGPVLRSVDHFVCIRSGDCDALRDKARVSDSRLSFIPLPADPDLVARPAPQECTPQYAYSAGNAHRDWATLLAALRMAPDAFPMRISAPDGLAVPMDLAARVECVGPLSPEDGRAMLAGSAVVVLCHHDTYRPHGPLVLLDALAMGKPVIASATSGACDYLDDGQTGSLVAAGDPEALALAISRLCLDARLRQSLGARAREACAAQFTSTIFTEGLLRVIGNVCA